MQLSVLIAAHNEGAHLLRTVEATHNALQGLEAEIIIADDASTDDAVAQVLAQYPEVRVVRHAERRGASPTKHLATTVARGEIFLFLDGHTNPEPHALAELVRDIALHDGRAIVVPAIAQLDPNTWQNHPHQVGYGYTLELTTLQTRWLARAEMTQREREGRTYYESPALIGCCFAISRSLYQELGGMDVDMQQWGVEDLDLGMKAWLHGCAVLVNPTIVIGHRFRKIFDNYPVDSAHILANELRFARKHFSEQTWQQWRLHQERQVAPALWNQALSLFTARRASVEQERLELQAARAYDEFWFAQKFSLPWPQAAGDLLLPPQPLRPRFRSMEGSPEPSPEPSPGPSPEPGSGSGSGSGGGGGDNCPKPIGNINHWDSLMDTNLWVLGLRSGEPAFNWCVQNAGTGNETWTTLPTACSNAGEGCNGIKWSTVIEPPIGTGVQRNLNTLQSKCFFSDFNLQFEYRCPNMRQIWKDCSSPVKGPMNWGNSGIKIFHQGASPGAEVVIADFDWDGIMSQDPNYQIPAYQASAPHGQAVPSQVQEGCTSGRILTYGKLCGAIYDKLTPQNKPLINPGVSPANPMDAQPWPSGNWNRMEIGFMAARYRANGQLARKATITVKISKLNNSGSVISTVSTLTRVGIPGFNKTNRQIPDKYEAGPKKGEWVYGTAGANFTRDSGPIYIQEHDSLIQFRNIKINTDWLPYDQNGFDEEWQAMP